MLVTLNTDGSYYPETKQGGYAFWISSNEGKFKRYGPLKNCNCDSPLKAEMMAICNGLHFIRNHHKLKECSKIIVNTDCEQSYMNLKSGFGRKKNKTKKHLRTIRGVMTNYIGLYKGRECKIEFRHVKAHSKNTSSREYVNNWLDKHAKLGAKLCT